MYPTTFYSSVSPIYTAPSMSPAVSGYLPVVSAPPPSVDSLVARTIEQLTRQVAALTQIVTQFTAYTTAPTSVPITSTAASSTVKTDSAMANRRSPFECYNCQAEGHIARKCLLPPQHPRQTENTGSAEAGLQGQGRPNQK